MDSRINHYPPPPVKKHKKQIPVLLMAAALIAIMLAGLPFLRGYVIKNSGIELKPADVYTVINAQSFLQNDERWAQDKLGASSYSMGSSGCLVCCIASVMCQYGADTDPGRLNRALYENGVYNEDGDILWERLKTLGFSHQYQNDFSAPVIERLLQDGQLPVVKVKYKGKGAFHWVLIVGSNKDDFLIMDPLNTIKEPIGLKTHGKVYAYRVLKKI